jgi:hypothetical protein
MYLYEQKANIVSKSIIMTKIITVVYIVLIILLYTTALVDIVYKIFKRKKPFSLVWIWVIMLPVLGPMIYFCFHTKKRLNAQKIFETKVKILSPATLNAVKNDTRQLIENRRAEKVVPATESRTGDPPNNDEPQQGETPEVQPHGNALPP